MAQYKVALVAYDADEVPQWVVEQINGVDIELAICQSANEDEALQCARGADLVWIFGGPKVISDRALRALEACRVILRSGSGTDNIPVGTATQLGIIVANTPEAAAVAVAEHAFGLLLAVVRQIPLQDRAIRGGTWDKNRGRPKGPLEGQTLGLVGFGHIARLLARMATGFDLRTIACDPYIEETVFTRHGVEPASFDQVLSESDFLSIHTPLVESTHHLIGERALKLMKPTAILINTSRGGVIDEPALARALASGQIAAAGLDVMEQQPPDPANPLLQLDNVVLTPHIAAFSDRFWHDYWTHSIRTIIECARTGRPLWTVNPEVTPRLGS